MHLLPVEHSFPLFMVVLGGPNVGFGCPVEQSCPSFKGLVFGWGDFVCTHMYDMKNTIYVYYETNDCLK